MERVTLTGRGLAGSLPVVKALSNYGDAVRALRGSRSQASVADAAGVDIKTVSNVERGATATQIDKLDAILTALGADVFTFALAVANAQGLEVPDSARAQAKLHEQAKFRRSTDADLPRDGDLLHVELRKLQDRIQDLEARLYGNAPRVTPHPTEP